MKGIKLFLICFGCLIGSNIHSQSFAEFVVSFDHLNATYNRITPSLGFMCVSTGAAYDHQGNRLWFNSKPTCALVGDFDLYCIDTQNGTTLNHFVSYTTGSEFVAPMVYDNSTDTLYGIWSSGVWPDDQYLAWIDQTTGAINLKCPLPYISGIIQSELTLDEENHRMMFLGLQDTSGVYYRLYTINVNTGALIHSPYLTSSLGLLKLANFTYNHSDDKLYAVVDSSGWTDSHLQTFDLATGTRTSVVTIPKRHVASFNTCALNEASNHFIYVSQFPDPDTIYTVDINTQTVIHREHYPFDPAGASDTIENVLNYFYDPSEQTIFAIHYGKLSKEPPTGINEFAESFNIFPNPSSGKLTISNIHKMDEVSVFNEMGQCIKTYYPEDIQLEVDLSMHPPGIYWLKLRCNDQISTRKIVIR